MATLKLTHRRTDN